MNYFDYLRMTRKNDTKESFESYLVEVLGYTIREATKEAEFMYKDEKC